MQSLTLKYINSSEKKYSLAAKRKVCRGCQDDLETCPFRKNAKRHVRGREIPVPRTEDMHEAGQAGHSTIESLTHLVATLKH